MPKFKLPPEKKPKDKDMPVASSDGDYMRRIHLPVNEAILDSVKVDDEVHVMLHGVVVETSKHDSPDYKNRSVVVKVSEIEIYPESEEKAEEDFKHGYRKGAGSKR